MQIKNLGPMIYGTHRVGDVWEVSDVDGKHLLESHMFSQRFRLINADEYFEKRYSKPIPPDAFVSILMPAYNSEKYISLILDDVLNQSWKNFELLIYDDGSTDRTRQIIEKYSAKDKRVRILGDGKNHGVGYARRELIKASQYPVSMWIDSDDRISRFKLEMMLGSYLELVKTPLLVSCCWEKIDADPSNDPDTSAQPKFGIPQYPQFNLILFTSDKNILPGDGIEEKNFGEDRQWYDACCAAGYSELMVNETLSYYRIHSNSLTAQHTRHELPKLPKQPKSKKKKDIGSLEDKTNINTGNTKNKENMGIRDSLIGS